jgi:hypothetical protein
MPPTQPAWRARSARHWPSPPTTPGPHDDDQLSRSRGNSCQLFRPLTASESDAYTVRFLSRGSLSGKAWTVAETDRVEAFERDLPR